MNAIPSASIFSRLPEQPDLIDDAPFLLCNRAKRVIDAAVRMTGFDHARITGPLRDTDTARVRWAIMLALHQVGFSGPQIGRQLGNRDHTTVQHGLRRVGPLRQTLPGYDRFCRTLIDVAKNSGVPA